MGSYVPSNQAERQAMLQSLGVSSVKELYDAIPPEVLLNRELNIPEGKAEMAVRDQMEALAAKNVVFPSVFRGAGAYRHYIPSIAKYIPAKEEFLTSYTPYQAEISQGVLQAIFEFQTDMCELMGMPVANASVYDGSTAAAEAAAMCRERKRQKTLISATAQPDTIQVVRTYCEAANAELVVVPAKDGRTDKDALRQLLDDTTASFYVQQPNYYGLLEDCEELGQIVHEKGAKYIMGCNPIALGMLKTPGECGADVATAEGQPLGMPLSFGGPYLGIMTCTEKMMRKMPGRIVGQTVDAAGERCFVLTLQAREQHIRREKASSNICSNQALCALTATVYLAAMGPGGLAEVASQCYSKAHYAAQQISAIPGFELQYQGEYFHEFVTGCPVCPEKLMAELEKHGILGGLPLEGGQILWCVTERNSKEEIDTLVQILKEVAAQ
ncbi:MAG TPA: aminomethyl-transferring glycine dehydrogenase subunit GcvPA [Firmicutes bacterium]|nr:aminomethyl-transferring glycine dehydrogenase subunit GcvPA [Bacillota bacterium]